MMVKNPAVTKWPVVLIRVLIFCIGCAVVLAASSGLMRGAQAGWVKLLHPLTACLGSLLLTMLFIRWESLRLEGVGLIPGRKSIFRLSAGFALGLLLAVLHATLVLITGHIKFYPVANINPSLIFLNLLFFLVLAFREEVSFHAYPLRALNYKIGPWAAQLIIAVIFAVEHIMGGVTPLHAFLGAGVGSLFFGYAALKSEGLALPVGIHAAWNFGQWSVGLKDGTGLLNAAIEPGHEAGVENMETISYLAVIVAGVLALYFYFRKNKPVNQSC